MGPIRRPSERRGLSEALTSPRFSVGRLLRRARGASSLGPYHLSRELALSRTLVCSTWRPPSTLGFERMSKALRRLWSAQPFLSAHGQY